MDPGPAIEAQHLAGFYGDVLAVDWVSFTVAPGEIFGLLGHARAGKTSLLRLLLGLLRPAAGTARVLGHDVFRDPLAVRRLSGFLPATFSPPRDLTARQFLHSIAAMFSLPQPVADERTETLLQRFGLEAYADRRLDRLPSGLMRQLGLAQALVNDPRVLFLDEPTLGMDQRAREEMFDLLRQLTDEHGITVVYASRMAAEVETMCRRVAVLHDARLMACDEIARLKGLLGVRTIEDLLAAVIQGPAS
jgi:ABC-2 type transport system ATP-binding protein